MTDRSVVNENCVRSEKAQAQVWAFSFSESNIFGCEAFPMPARPRKAIRKPRTTIKRFPDRHTRKRAPNGVRSVMLAIQNYWLALKTERQEDEHLTPGQFCHEAGFDRTFEEAFERYPAMSGRPDKLYRLVQKLTNGTHNIEFVHLLAFAEYVKVPLSLFMLFAQMVSDELRATDANEDRAEFRKHALRTLRRIRYVIERAEQQVVAGPEDQSLFIHVYDEFEEAGHLMAKALALKFWSDVYNSQEALAAAREAVTEMLQPDQMSQK